MPISPSKKHRFKRSPTVAYLSITSLMDMFTIILLFLLHGFSQDEGAFAISQKLTLPVSTSIEAVRPKLTIQITEKELIIEGKKVIDIMNEQGLIQGKNSLEIYAMCEIPANVILADKFLEIFDGYSIGSNDLTQLTLGVDRESAKIAHIFDERNEAVKRMLKMAIEACKARGKYIGICGQAPSDYPEITGFLVQNGIDSISLNPDSLFKMRQVVADLEESLSL